MTSINREIVSRNFFQSINKILTAAYKSVPLFVGCIVVIQGIQHVKH